MRLPRFTIRRMMVLVAVVGLAIGVGVEGYRHYFAVRYFRARAAEAAELEHEYRGHQINLRESLDDWLEQSRPTEEKLKALSNARATRTLSSDELLGLELLRNLAGAANNVADDYRKDIEECNSLIDYYARLKAKYERASRYPWLTVDPDRDPPKLKRLGTARHAL